MTKRRTTIEKPEGRGVIRTTDGKSVSMRYFIVVLQTVDDEPATGQLAGQLAIRGAIEVNQGQGIVDLTGQRFTLETNDGRCLEVWAKKGDPVSRYWELVGTGPKGLVPC